MLFQKLNDAQLQAVTSPLKPTLVLAGAGSGKTRVLTNRIAYLVKECGVSPSEILAITFTNKAANEMKRRLYEFDCNAQFMRISTIHSFCAYVLRNESKIVDRNSNFTIYSEDDKKSVIKKVVKSVLDDTDSKVVEGFADAISDIKNNGVATVAENFAEYRNNAVLNSSLERLQNVTEIYTDNQLVEVIKEYEKRMSENNAMDFDDLLYFVHKLFKEVPQVLEKYQEYFKYILIDEFQDTNKVQYEIFKLLGAKYKNVFVVGDDDQSIYSWRGADITNIINFPHDFEDTQIFKLEQNYRSTKRILDVANNIISKNTGRYDKVLWTDNEDGVKAQLFQAYSEQDEAYYVCEQIKSLRYLSSGFSFKDCAILMRVNALSPKFEQMLARNHIPFKVFGGYKFFERKEIRDIVAYLRILVNPCDAEAFIRIINEPHRRGIGDTTIKKLQDLSAEYGICLYDVISDERNLETFNSGTRSKLTDFYAELEELNDLRNKLSLKEFIHEFLLRLDFRNCYVSSDEEDRALNVDAFEESVNDYCKENPLATLNEYLQNVALASDTDTADDSDYVTVATIHAVKGLEFKCVFVVGMEDGIFPSARSLYDNRDYQEERRLMYVAVTRAEKRLYLTCARSRFLYGQRRESILPSKYYLEVQKFLAPQRAPLTERQMQDDRFIDKLIDTEPITKPVDNGRTNSEIAQYKVGCKVMHKTFGEGMIIRTDKYVVDVIFSDKSVGKKSLDVRFAPLIIL